MNDSYCICVYLLNSIQPHASVCAYVCICVCLCATHEQGDVSCSVHIQCAFGLKMQQYSFLKFVQHNVVVRHAVDLYPSPQVYFEAYSWHLAAFVIERFNNLLRKHRI